MKIAVAGSRHYTDYEEAVEYIDRCIHNLAKDEENIILSGGCRGADMLGERYALEHIHKIERFPARWDKYGKAAGIIRNKRIADSADVIICFWDGKSKGTKALIEYAKKLGKTIHIHKISLGVE